MRKVLSATLASLLLATSVVSSASAAPRYQDRERFVQNYCANHPRDRDCRDFRDHHTRWDRNRYDRWYHDHNHDFGPADAAAAIFGFAAGAIAGAAAGAANGAANGTHVARCEAQYRSYNRNTDMYLGFDGNYHYCRL